MTNPSLRDLNLKLGRRVDRGGLDAIPRSLSRKDLQLPDGMRGFDLWNAYEVSFLLPGGKPVVLHLQAAYHADTPAMVESKSFKLFLNGYNNQTFENIEAFESEVREHLQTVLGGAVELRSYLPDQSPPPQPLPGQNLDALSPETVPKVYDPGVLASMPASGPFCCHTHLLRTQCPITNQPDWGSVTVEGAGPRQPATASLLAYLISFRNRPDFHETCCEVIFSDLHHLLEPDHLTVTCRYTRRGGLDINPVRTTLEAMPPNPTPSWRQ